MGHSESTHNPNATLIVIYECSKFFTNLDQFVQEPTTNTTNTQFGESLENAREYILNLTLSLRKIGCARY